MKRSEGKRVAVIERDERAALVLGRALEARGWTVTQVRRSRDLARAERPDILVAALDGDEAGVLEALVRLAAAPVKTPIVLLTRRARSRVLDSLHALGVDRLISWPCRVQEIVAAIDELRAAGAPLRLVS